MAKQLFRFVSLCMLALFMCDIGTFAQTSSPEVTLDFTDKSAWDIPTSGTNTALGTYYNTNGKDSVKLYATTNYKMNTGYLILGKKDSYLELPAFDFDVEKIEVVGHSGASTAVKQNIYVGTTEVSAETTGADGVTNTYAIASGNQAAGNIYKLVVTSAHNTQIEAIKIYKKSSGGETTTVSSPTFSVSGGKYYEPFELTLSCTTTGASIYYTLDGTDPTSESTFYTGAINISATTTVKAIAVSGDDTSDVVSATYTFPTAVANIAGLADVANGEEIVLTLTDAQVLYVNGSNDVYIKDDTGAMDFFKSGLTFTAGQVLNGTIIASNSPYNGIYEIKPISGKTTLDNVTVTDGTAVPVVMTTAEASESSAYCQLVTINNVTPVADGSYFYTDDTKTLQIYDKYNLGYSLDATKKYNVTGIIITFKKNNVIYSEIAPTVVPEEVEEPQEFVFRDIKADLTQLQALATESDVYIAVAEDGTISQTDDAEHAAATLKGKWHSAGYGWSNFTASVPVEGTVKITYATHDYGNDITVTNAEGETVATLNTKGAKWSSSHDNVVSTYYRVNEPTTLHFSNANYNPYFAVEAIDPADIPAEVTKYNVTFAVGDATGVAPTALEVEGGNNVKLPKNYTLYKEGYTLTGWSDGSETYEPGAQITPSADMALTPVFTANTVSLADRTADVEVVWQLGESNTDNAPYNFNGTTGIIVTQATVNGETIDVKADVDGTAGKLVNTGRGDQYAQVNPGAKITVPACKGATVGVNAYAAITATTINGVVGSSVTIEDDVTSVDIVDGESGQYFISVSSLLPYVSDVPEFVFRDIKADLTQLQALATESDVYITVDEDGTISQTDDAEHAAATLKGKWHSADYGWSNFTASVPVEGTVKITYATHDYGNDITVTNAEGETVATLNTKGAKWSSSHDNVVSTYYRVNEPTTLHFSKANYNPYFAVEAIDPADIPAEVTKYNVTFAAGEGATGNAPAAIEVEAGGTLTAPVNYYLYKEGYTLTGWSDGTTTYNVGAEITPEADMTLTAVYTANEVELADREAAVTINFVLDGYNDNPQYKFEGGTGVIVTQATVNGKSIDVAANVDATSGKFATNGSGWHQVNANTKVTVPSAKEATISVSTYNDGTGTSMTFNGEQGTGNNVITYTATAEDATCEIAQVSNNYWNSLTITLPAVGGEEENPFPLTEDVTATWDFSDSDVMAATMALSGTTTPGKVDDVAKDGIKMTVEANGATFRNNNGTNIQVRTGAVFKVPVQSTDDVVTVNGYPSYSFYTIGNNTTVLNDVNTYKAKLADVEQGYVAITSMNDNNYYYSISVDLKAPKAPVTLDNEPVVATFPFHEGTEKQTAEFGDDADYFLSSKVAHGSGLTITGKKTPKDLDSPVETLFQPTSKVSEANADNAIQFIIIPKPGFSFTPTSVSITATRFGTNDGQLDFAWLNPDNTTVTLATGQRPNRNDGTKKHETDTEAKFTTYTYEISGATVAEGQCGLQVNLYGLAKDKQIGFSDIIINGTLSGTEKDMPILASFKLNGTEYAADDVFEIDGTDYVGNIKLSKTEAMVSAENPLTEITAASGEVGTVTYEGSETACTVTIPVTAGEESINYILSVTQKPDYTLTYIGLDGTAIDTQTVEEDATIGEFAVDIATVEGAQEGYKARGWFKNNYVGEKFQTTDVITSDANLYAIETEIEGPSDSRKYTFNLADPFFYAEDHEAFTPTEGSKCKFHDTTHGWSFYNDDQVDLLVGPKATIYVTLCQYGSGTNILVLDAEGNTLGTLDGKSTTDGELQTYAYEGAAGKVSLKFVASGEMYIHNVKIVNTTTTNYAQDGQWITVKAGDVSSFIDAIDAANGMSGDERVYIFLPNGTYNLGQTCLTQIGRNNISIIGQSTEGTIIENSPKAEGISVTATLLNTSNNLYMQDLTLRNNWDYYNIAGDGRGVCLQDKGNNTICKNVRMLSYQDTYYTNNTEGNFYWEDSEIHGTVDFICGEGTLFMENSKLFVEKRNADGTGECTITAPSTKDGNQYGYVFNNCTIENEAESFNLGRAWNNKPRAAYLNTTIINDKLISTRWRVAGMNNNNPVEFVEYKSVDESGSVISPESNVVTFTNAGGVTMETILTDAQAANFTLDKVFPSWSPAEFTVQVVAPDAEMTDGVITWSSNDNAIAYALFKNGELLGITTDTSFDTNTDSEAHAAPRKAEGDDVYTIRAANLRGGFGEAKTIEIAIADGIEGVSTEKGKVVSTTYYNVAGARVSDSAKGVLLKVEKLENGKTVTTKVVR